MTAAVADTRKRRIRPRREVMCPDCGERRTVSHTTERQIHRGLKSGRCRRCGPPGRRRSRPERCLGCGRPMRHGGTRVADAPGTVPHSSAGYCVTCARNRRRDLSAAIGRAVETSRLGCTDDPDWYADAARRLDVRGEDARRAAAADLAEEADLRCWGCPVAAQCEQLAAVDRLATGVYGGALWYEGNRIVAGQAAP